MNRVGPLLFLDVHLVIRQILVVTALSAIGWCLSGQLLAQPPVDDDPLVYTGPPRKQDEVILIDTRALEKPSADEAVKLPLKRFSEAGKWEEFTVEAFVRDSEADVPTIVYVHGYDFSDEKAERVGWAMYHALCDELPSQQRVRYVIWSWPSVAKRFRRGDVRDKSIRGDAEGYWLAWLIAQLPAKSRVNVVGSALGCAAVEGMLHISGGGEIDGWQVARSDDTPGPAVRAVFISAAIHDYWLYEGEFHDQALKRCEGLLLLNNSHDPTLVNYHRAWSRRPAALGLDGLPNVEKFGELAKRIEQFDAHEVIGQHHGVENYLRSPELVGKLREFLLQQ